MATACQLIGWDVTRETITRIETRQRLVSDYEIFLLATVLGIDASDLLPASPNISSFLSAAKSGKALPNA